jgi:hypothetical protein
MLLNTGLYLLLAESSFSNMKNALHSKERFLTFTRGADRVPVLGKSIPVFRFVIQKTLEPGVLLYLERLFTGAVSRRSLQQQGVELGRSVYLEAAHRSSRGR